MSTRSSPAKAKNLAELYPTEFARPDRTEHTQSLSLGKEECIVIMIKTLILTHIAHYSGSIIIGVIGFLILQYLYDRLLGLAYGYETLSAMDYIFLYDEPSSRANIVACFKFKKFDSKKMAQVFKERALKFKRMK